MELSNSTRAGKFFGKLFHSRDVAHLQHLSVKGQGSFAKHLALEDYYKAIVKLSDSLIECYQGTYGIVDNIEISISTSKLGSLSYYKELKKFIMTERNLVFSDSYLINISDEILAEISKLIYKLENLE